MNKKYKTLALLPVLSVLLTACTLQDLPLIGGLFKSKEQEVQPVTLNIWGLWEDPAIMEKIGQKYTESHPNVTITYEDRSIMPLPDYKERVYGRFQDPSAEIDIAMVHNSWVSRMSSFLSPMPEGLMDVSTYESTFYAPIVQSGIVDNQIKAVPVYYDGLVLVYNKEHFAEINQNLPPTAWEEFRRLALELTVRGEDGSLVRSGAALGTADNINHFSDILGLMWAQADIGVDDSIRGRSHYGSLELYNKFVNELDTKPAYDALTFYTNFVKEDAVWNKNMPEATTAFAQGKVSMIFVPSWAIIDIISSVPDASVVGVAPVPQAIPSDPRAWASFWMFTVPTNSPNASVAWDFLNFFEQEEQQLMYFDEASKVRFYGAPYPLKALSSEITSDKLTPVLETAPFARSWEIAARAGNVTQVGVLRDAVNSSLSGTPAKTALTTAKQELTK